MEEVGGKNTAIHAYDGIIWKIRTGFLTLLFVGWSVLLKSIADDPGQPINRLGILCIAMLVFSLCLALGAWLVDINYLHRKYRVILALNSLTDKIKASPDDLSSIPNRLLQVSGDSSDNPYKCEGYKLAYRTSLGVFFLPPLILSVAAAVIICFAGNGTAPLKPNTSTTPSQMETMNTSGNMIDTNHT
ncbi:hypothetical protein [Pontiella desulfatans]|uniref:hypothetical protein n=1 Tax=Pontiella desulfatans TaxID=2750659 RepID=UPI00109CD453|nr:hypothetical protein [Pontiella desulfatans]